MKQLHLIVSGRVQGVYYRWFVKEQADKLQITGWVKNLENGNVEIVAQGEEDNLKKLHKLCKQGPPNAKVENIEQKEETVTKKYADFTIQR